MNLFQAVAAFFESLFNKNSPEIQKKQQLKKLEAEMKAYQPAIFKNGSLLPNFAEAMRIFYENIKPVDDVLATTIGGTNIQRTKRFEHQLVMTGYSDEGQRQLDAVSYEARKKEVAESSMTTSQVFEIQLRRLEKLISELNGESFRKIDKTLASVHQLADLCRFNFVTVLQIFDPSFVPLSRQYTPSYQEIPVERIGNTLEDFYFLVAGLNLTTAVANAVGAIAQLQNKTQDLTSLTENLKKIAYILNHILSPEKLKSLIRFYRKDIAYNPKTAEYKGSARQDFANMLQERFKADEIRIKTELKDEKIRDELSRLFSQDELLTLNGYNEDADRKLKANSPVAFMWIMPLRILKTFLSIYMTDHIKTLLNNIVVEGFFNNPEYKSDFSVAVYAALECSDNVSAFEESFNRGGANDIALLDGYLRDSHRDSDFFKKIKDMVNKINGEANKLITKETNSLNALYKYLGDIIQDAKKPASELISNLKVLMLSSRNGENTDLLMRQYPSWHIFFEIMKNYAIISTKETVS